MTVSNEDLQYLPYNDRNRGRIFTRDCQENIKLFIADFKATEFGARLVNEQLAYGTNLDEILGAAWEQFGHEDVCMNEYVQAAKSLYLLGDLKPKPAPVAPVAAPKQLSASQLQWRAWREYTDSHSVAECRAKARVDEGYRKFLSLNLEREMNDTRVPDAVVAIGTTAVRQDKTVKITQELNDWAHSYRLLATSEVRRLSSPLTNPAGYKTFSENLEKCISAGLI